MESFAHGELKRIGASFLAARGYGAISPEVRCPGSRYRVDVAGYRDREPPDPAGAGPRFDARRGAPRPAPPRTVLIECKQSRGDLLREVRDGDALLRRRERLRRERARIEEELAERHPEILRGDPMLFGGAPRDLDAIDHAPHRAVLRELRRVERTLYGQTKFWTIARYGLADRLYILAPRGLVAPEEVPTGWGLLDCDHRALRRTGAWSTGSADAQVRVMRAAPRQHPAPRRRAELLRNIAVAATRELTRPVTRPLRDPYST